VSDIRLRFTQNLSLYPQRTQFASIVKRNRLYHSLDKWLVFTMRVLGNTRTRPKIKCSFYSITFYWPTTALNSIKLKGENLRCVSVLKDN